MPDKKELSKKKEISKRFWRRFLLVKGAIWLVIIVLFIIFILRLRG
ncbi:MAG: hypothetical protein KJ709_00680 [Nanoarchaeota archaeon]|nr:hypothetical protein [Nanoarchaeota archaeon]